MEKFYVVKIMNIRFLLQWESETGDDAKISVTIQNLLLSALTEK